MHFGGKFIKQKLLDNPNLVGVGHLTGPHIWKDLGLDSLSRGVYKIKVVVHNHRDRALAWRGPQGPGRPMSGYPPHTLLIKLNLIL